MLGKKYEMQSDFNMVKDVYLDAPLLLKMPAALAVAGAFITKTIISNGFADDNPSEETYQQLKTMVQEKGLSDGTFVK